VETDAVLAGIDADGAVLVALLGSLHPADFARATPCAAWDVTHLVAHLYRDFERVPEALASPTSESPDTDWISYWAYDRPTNQAQTQDRARRITARLDTPAALVTGFTDMLADALTRARSTPTPWPNTRLAWGPVVSFDDLLRTRWLELVVHSLDLTDALGRTPLVSPEGLAFTAATLDGLAGRALSAELGWSSPADYVRAGTGRRALTDEDRARLDGLDPALASRFPLLA
jgi:uncharacterized protein (TIGR03083 family)